MTFAGPARAWTSHGETRGMQMKDTDRLLAEQVAYYRAAAAEYSVYEVAARDLATALDEFEPAGDVLELACGPGCGRNSCFVTRIRSPPWTGPRRCSPEPAPAWVKAAFDSSRRTFSNGRQKVEYDFVFFGF